MATHTVSVSTVWVLRREDAKGDDLTRLDDACGNSGKAGRAVVVGVGIRSAGCGIVRKERHEDTGARAVGVPAFADVVSLLAIADEICYRRLSRPLSNVE